MPSATSAFASDNLRQQQPHHVSDARRHTPQRGFPRTTAAAAPTTSRRCRQESGTASDTHRPTCRHGFGIPAPHDGCPSYCLPLRIISHSGHAPGPLCYLADPAPPPVQKQQAEIRYSLSRTRAQEARESAAGARMRWRRAFPVPSRHADTSRHRAASVSRLAPSRRRRDLSYSPFAHRTCAIRRRRQEGSGGGFPWHQAMNAMHCLQHTSGQAVANSGARQDANNGQSLPAQAAEGSRQRKPLRRCSPPPSMARQSCLPDSFLRQ